MDQPQEYYGQEPPTEVNPSDYTETPQYRNEEAGTNEPQPQNEQPQSNTVLDSLAEKGYDVSNFSSDEELINETEARYAASSQAQENIQRHNEYVEYQRSQQQAAPSQEMPTRQTAPESGSGKPEFDERWANLVETDESGRYVVREEYVGTVDPSIADKINDYVSWRQQRSNSLIDDPVNTIMQDGLGNQIDARIRNAVSQELGKNRVESEAQEFIQQNADALYVKNGETGEFQRDQGGRPILSAAGQALNSAHVTLREQGMYDPVARHQVAMQMVQNHLTQSQISSMNQQNAQQNAPPSQAESYKQQYTDQPFSQPTNPLPPGHMPNTPVQPDANAIGAYGLPEHNSLGSLATALAVHKGYLQQKS